MAGKRVLVCGGRDYDDLGHVWSQLDAYHGLIGIAVVIHGGAEGADALAESWATNNNAPQSGNARSGESLTFRPYGDIYTSSHLPCVGRAFEAAPVRAGAASAFSGAASTALPEGIALLAQLPDAPALVRAVGRPEDMLAAATGQS